MVEKKTLVGLRASVHSQLLRARTLLRLTESEDFKVAFDSANEESRAKVSTIISSSDKDALEVWIKEEMQKRDGIDILPLRELRKLGQKLGVRGYTTLPKMILVDRIKGKQSNGRVESTKSSFEPPNPGVARLDENLNSKVCSSP